jgi:hypothetical protein
MTTDNRFFDNPFNVPIGSLARSPSIKAALEAAEAGFYSVMLELDALNGRGVKFQNLANVPATIEALKYVRGNAAANALEFVSGANVGFKTVTGTAYTLIPSDAGLCLETSSADPVAITVDTNANQDFEAGDVVVVAQNAAGQITFVPGSGVTISSSDSSLKTRSTQAQVALHYRGADAWRLIGERELAALAYASLVVPNQFTALQAVTSVSLTDAGTITTDAALGNNFRVTLGGNRTLGNPTNMTDGCILNWKIKQDGTGSRTLAYGSKFKWAGGTAPTLSTTAAARDFITAQYFSDEDILVAAIIKGLA